MKVRLTFTISHVVVLPDSNLTVEQQVRTVEDAQRERLREGVVEALDAVLERKAPSSTISWTARKESGE